jgi:hypothetical protein
VIMIASFFMAAPETHRIYHAACLGAVAAAAQ